MVCRVVKKAVFKATQGVGWVAGKSFAMLLEAVILVAVTRHYDDGFVMVAKAIAKLHFPH